LSKIKSPGINFSGLFIFLQNLNKPQLFLNKKNKKYQNTMKKILFLMLFMASSWIAKGQQTLTVSGNFMNQAIPVTNQQVTITYHSTDSISPVIGRDTTLTDNLGYYSFSTTLSAANFNGYAIVKASDCYGATQEVFGVFFPGYYNIIVNIECVNVCLNSFAASIDSIPSIGLMAKFKATKVSASANYLWTFGDGTSGVGSYVDHVYANPGTYTVCLTTSDSIGACTYTYCDSVLVSNAIIQCYATYSYYQDSTNANMLYFTGQTLNAPGSIISWDFGDGLVSTGNNYVTHTYSQPGIYNVCLGYFDIIKNCFTTFCDVVYVGSGVTPNCSAEYKMFMIPDSVTLGANVIYFSSIYQSPTSIYNWDFGDGTYASNSFTTHNFNGDGVFDVCLTIYDFAQSCSDTICKRVEIMNGGMKILGITNSENISVNNLYPNPTDGISYLTLNSKLPSNAKVNIYSIDGRLIFQSNKELTQGENNIRLDLTNIEPGMYFVEIMSKNERVTAKLMIK
jgi:PKD repeat protein